ncbi:MAG: AAA family ATPase [Patescibacteria group bacterium]
MNQELSLSILKTGANVFLTGEPGSGKTHTINTYAAYLRARGIEPAITASTGIAATHIGGMTIHSWSGIGIKTKLDRYELDRISSSEYIVRRVRKARVLIIDEVSMLSPNMLSMVDAVCREISQNPRPFGGLQIVLVGDFFQLPPIVKREEEDGMLSMLAALPLPRFAYDSSSWAAANPVVCYLTEQHRQDDADFLAMLSAIRRGAFTGEHLRHIEKRKVDQKFAPNGAPKLFSHNVDVDRQNNEMLRGVAGPARVFSMSSKGPSAVVASLTKGCLSPEELSLKVSASVMCTKNNPKEGFVNGTLGKVEAFSQYTGFPVVKMRSGRRVEVSPMDWTVEEGGKVRARITQLPLRLAWAITVHKSQGMSLDEAVMDLSDVFEFGQGYVALSRVRRLAGLHLLGWNERTFEVHPQVLAKDGAFQAKSGEAEATFSALLEGELQNMHTNFIRACGGRSGASKNASREKNKEKETALATMRGMYANAYQPWDKAQDKKLEELFGEGSSISELAKTFGRKDGAIRSRLAKLGFLEV